MKKSKIILRDVLFTIFILGLFFLGSVVLQSVVKTETLIPALFTLAVFLVSFYTEGYVYGIAASLICMLAVNFAYTFPYLMFNFSIFENLVSAIVMLVITILTSALTTKLKQSEKLKAESEKERMRANLLRAVSHDLRTPLTTIYGSSAAVLEHYDNLSKEQKVKLIQGIRNDADWMIGMVENLLSVTRIENCGVKIKKTQVVLDELIDSVLARFKKRYPDQWIDIELPEEFITIPMDAVLITQVLVNLLENAVLHAKGMTKLILRVYARGNKAVFEVIDDGCGIPPHRLDNIFTGYFEMKEAPVDHQKRSMGIGLSVCASVIKAHEGEIRVENLEEGGCCFRFSLKMEEHEGE